MTRPDVDEVLRLPHPWDRDGSPSILRLRVWLTHPLDPAGPVLAIVSDDDTNLGASVTNNAEQVVAHLDARFPGALVLEHYPRSGHVCEVTLDGRGRARWLPVGSALAALADDR